ncbi:MULTISPECIES: potassium channel family protein [Chryseobacterium]|uniref:NTP pyrophosphohydrolases containing a Zn-finger, probably nucleic-acid-binding n=1 Tax=Chryseobacterium taihuense TaxID=1141221 RepID=A0A4U8WIK3_9FLAO|nr:MULTISPECIES: potassium channel family protein [Chryseobacterium]VFB02538.1 NTP pyrophosphohydrolases containing a Zn-finger, probably nucleic-acid-binding [Chryseobacterium taihuense]
MKIKIFLNKRKYELLLAALIQHLFIGIIVQDTTFYTEVLWPVNMLILGLASIGVFIEKSKLKNITKNILSALVIVLPIMLSFFKGVPEFMFFLNISYIVFYFYIFLEVFKFLVKPSYINTDIISASACGLLLLLEAFVFMFQIYAYSDPQSFKGLDYSSPAHTFMDLVYFCSVTLTTIGYGDITPGSYQTKLITSLIGIVGQFYSVVLVGIIISKFSNYINK